MRENIQLQISEHGIETITVPYVSGKPVWIEVLSHSTWALELLHGSIRHYARSLESRQQYASRDDAAPAKEREKSK
jgi:hypothetical protein